MCCVYMERGNARTVYILPAAGLPEVSHRREFRVDRTGRKPTVIQVSYRLNMKISLSFTKY